MRRVTVAQLASEAGMEHDEALIVLWDAGFGDIVGPGDYLRRGDANRARRALGLATRRELASPEYWQSALQIPQGEFDAFMLGLGVAKPYEGGQLGKRAINRLRSELRRRGTRSQGVDTPEILPEQRQEYGPLEWRDIGHLREIVPLGIKDLEAIHSTLADDFANADDPISPAGVKSQDLLASAVLRPHTSIDGVSKYPTVEMAAAALFHALVHDHPFHNGNKRTAMVALLVFLDENGLTLTCVEDELFKLVLQLAQHAITDGPRNELPDREVLTVAQWIKDNSRLVEKGDRPLTMRRLKQILAEYGCETQVSQGDGCRLNISRTVPGKKRLLGSPRPRTLSVQVHYAGEGREVDNKSVKHIRRELELDDDHGIDSGAFYDHSKISASDFINTYRKTLRRLARL